MSHDTPLVARFSKPVVYHQVKLVVTMEEAIDLKRYLMTTFVLLFISLVPQTLADINKYESLHIMVVVSTPNNICNHLWPRWEKGEEILLGAQYAVDEINSSRISSLYQLKIIPVKVKSCDPIAEIESIVRKKKKKTTRVIAAVGYFCDNLIQFLSRLIAHETFGMIQISAMPTVNNNHTLPRFHPILPSPIVLVEAAIMLIQRLAISQIGIISTGLYHDVHYSKMTEAFHHMAQVNNITIEFQIKELWNANTNTLTRLKESTTQFIVVFLPPSEAVDVICNAHQEGFKWPYYIWVYVDINNNELVASSKQCSEHSLSAAMENAVFLHLMSWPNYEDYILTGSRNSYSLHYSDYLQQLNASLCLQFNPYASILYDSIWAIARALNNSMGNMIDFDTDWIEKQLTKLTFQGATGFLNFSQKPAAVQISVAVFQVQQREAILIGSYTPSLNQLQLNATTLDEAVNSEFQNSYVLYPPHLTVILCIIMAISFTFTTAMMSLFIHYRKTPKVKATSSVLSLCMFVGCYCLILSSLLHTIDSSLILKADVLRYTSCWGNTFLFTIAMDLVLATVFAKTLRIYHIFTTFRKVSKLWSDKGLFALILAIVTGKVAIMIVWGAVDMNHLIDDIISPRQGFPPHYLVVQKCHSNHLTWWVVLVFGYSAVLFLPMIFVAILTRKIKRREFKDSKKICALVAILFIHVWIGTALWFVLREVGAHIASKIVFSVSFSMVAIICQVFLFVPKIIPPECVIKLARIKNAAVRSYNYYSYRRISLT